MTMLAAYSAKAGRLLEMNKAMASYHFAYDTDDYTPDSWIEISSRPSSSSLSSATDDVVTTGLRVQYDSTTRRRRRTAPSTLHLNISTRPPSASGSSQEEYEESESESDRVLNSSNEDIQPSSASSPAFPPESGEEGEDYGEDENGTVLGINSNLIQQCFTPQPNAFSHPPSSQSRSHDFVPGSYFPSTHPSSRPASQRHSYSTQDRRHTHTPYNIISPSHQADHDAALRDSLSTLLSCAAAARGLPKSKQTPTARARPASTTARVDPSTLRMVPESALLGGTAPTSPARRPSASTTSISSCDAHTAAATNQDKGKRKAAVVRSNSKDRRAVKKPRRVLNIDESISPTLLTWVVSAGVLVLVSALSFSAGYAVGREAGAVEAGSGWAAAGGEGVRGCGKEVGRSGLGLRRLRWGGGAGAVRV